jgi:hypothetical protein
VAPESARVDLASPTFSNPTKVSNPLFPISKQASVLLLGRVDGKPFRTEVTLLPETRIIKTEVKTFGRGYGEFLTGGGGDVEALALAVPPDALSGPPAELVKLESGAADVFDAVQSKDWRAAQATVRAMAAA